MKGRLPQLAAAALVVSCASFLTPAALAGGGKPKHHKKSSDCGVSASCVYVEHVPSGGGPVAVDSQPTTAAHTLKLPKKVHRALQAHGGKDASVLEALVTNPGRGATRVRFLSNPDAVLAPSAIGAAFDLGTGPIALFAGLLAGALLMGGGMALRRRSRAPARTAR